ncbi:MAG: S8 family serine peptidase, partial [Acidobacteriota bacterium]
DVHAQVIIDNKLSEKLTQALPAQLIPVIVTYNTLPSSSDIELLRNLGIQYGVKMKELPMAGIWATAAQINQLATQPNVRSLYLNRQLQYFNREGTAMIGAVKQRTMPGWGYSGRGIGVALVDSGIDATHPDLPYGSHVKQNAKVLIGDPGLGSVFTGIVPVNYLENLPNSDTSSGHGTHCAGTIGGLGTQSAGAYAGVAPGATLIGVSSGEAIFVLWAIEGLDYVLTHQYVYNIKVVSNSWGTSGPFDPEDPVNIASKILHDRGITVVFAAGNAGPGSNTINPYSVAPWVISVAAGDKQSKLADFSSRGIRDDALYHPTITAPGVNITSCKTSLLGAISTCENLPPAQVPYYACMSGTSMATPHVSGVVALLLEANPNLTPDQIKSILRATATRMVGYEEYQVGAGFVNVLAALDAVRNLNKVYGSVLNQTYNAKFTGSQTVEQWQQDWSPLAAPPQHSYTINANGLQSDVFISWDLLANSFNLSVTDPANNRVSTGSNLLAAVFGLEASLSFSQPMAGQWQTTVYGIRGESTGTTGLGVPDTIHGTVLNYYGTFTGLNDINNSPYAAYIRRAVSLRLMDSVSTSNFNPNSYVTRGEIAKIIASDCYVRQNLLNNLPYTDVSASLAPYVQAVTASGAPMRDIFFTSGPIMTGVNSSSFNPNGSVIRAEAAVWLVRALGLESLALSKMSNPTNFTDDSEIPTWARGYVVVANEIGLMTGFANPTLIEGAPVTYSWKPNQKVVRGAMAVIITKWYDIFTQ